MYNVRKIKRITDQATKEANEVAQAIFDKYQVELMEAIQAQLHKDDILYCANGTAFVDRNGQSIEFNENEFIDYIGSIQWGDIEGITASFDFHYKINKFEIIEH